MKVSYFFLLQRHAKQELGINFLFRVSRGAYCYYSGRLLRLPLINKLFKQRGKKRGGKTDSRSLHGLIFHSLFQLRELAEKSFHCKAPHGSYLVFIRLIFVTRKK